MLEKWGAGRGRWGRQDTETINAIRASVSGLAFPAPAQGLQLCFLLAITKVRTMLTNFQFNPQLATGDLEAS